MDLIFMAFGDTLIQRNVLKSLLINTVHPDTGSVGHKLYTYRAMGIKKKINKKKMLLALIITVNVM